MSTIGSTGSRTTSQLFYQGLLSQIRRTQAELLRAQDEISSGKRIEKPSDAPAKVAAILEVQRQLGMREQRERNLGHAESVLNNTDQSLGDVTAIINEAKSIASSQVSVGSSAETRRNQAAVIDAQIEALQGIANRKYQNIWLFGGAGGQAGPDSKGLVFTESLGGIRYAGTRRNLAGDSGLDNPLDFNFNGEDAFAALSARVQSPIDLNPKATADTFVRDVNGAQGQGVRLGTVVVNVDGTEVAVDLNSADTLGDVAARINAAIVSVDSGAGSLAISAGSGAGFALTAASGHQITISDQGSGQAAADLGIVIDANGATVVGGDIDTRLTERTRLDSLPAGLDLTSGMTVKQGETTKVLNFSGAVTVADLMNRAQQLNLGVRMEVNDQGSSLNLVSEISGLEVSFGENGGTTAEDLGLRTFASTTQLTDFNHGIGIHQADGDDFAIHLHNGSSFNVDIQGATTVADVIAKVKAAASAASLTVGDPGQTGTDFNIGLSLTGNGLTLEDGSAGTGEFRVEQLGQSLAALDLGIYQNAGSGASIAGQDTASVRVEGVFTHLMALRDALMRNDDRGITLAGEALETDSNSVIQARADVGVRTQRVTQAKTRSEDMKLAEKSMLSELRDADLSEVITRFTQLQQQLEASMRVGAQAAQLSLLDFLS